ncbi:hypothetical protein [Sphingomonas sp.]|uniref:hypothetical protein n=1 Tax=Sphingomonas sp. TaxID=28214 RepID=UPI003B003C10
MFEQVEGYRNRHRIHSALDCLTPDEARQRLVGQSLRVAKPRKIKRRFGTDVDTRPDLRPKRKSRQPTRLAGF